VETALSCFIVLMNCTGHLGLVYLINHFDMEALVTRPCSRSSTGFPEQFSSVAAKRASWCMHLFCISDNH